MMVNFLTTVATFALFIPTDAFEANHNSGPKDYFLSAQIKEMKNDVDEKMRTMQAKVDESITEKTKLEKEMEHMRDEMIVNKQLIQSLNTKVNSNITNIGSTYIRWGRTECPSTAEIVYKGKTFHFASISRSLNQ